MNHKRKGPKSTRAGCLLCKPHKHQRARLNDRARHSVVKRLDACAEALLDQVAPGTSR